MADTTSNNTAPAKKTPAKPAKGAAGASKAPAKAAPRKTAATAKAPDAAPPQAPVIEAKSRFNAALEEAKAGAAALRAEAENRLTAVGGQAKGKGTDLVAEAKTYAETAKGKAGEIAVEGKQVASDAIASLGKVVGESAAQIDEKLGAQYGDYARKASRTLQETSAKLETKSVEELGEDARAMVRKSPGVAVGVAAVVGFFLARLLGGRKR
jgi:ElaB/YqjD/DUF883 family membrane-anchored ribosome-binding protein